MDGRASRGLWSRSRPVPAQPSPALGRLRGQPLLRLLRASALRPGLPGSPAGAAWPEVPSWVCGPASRVGICERARWCRFSMGQPGREEGCTGLGRWRRRRRLQQLQPTNVLLLASPSPGATRKVGGWRASLETHLDLSLGLIFRKKGKRGSGKGAPRRKCKGWEWCLEKGGGGADRDWRTLRKLMFGNNFSILFFS